MDERPNDAAEEPASAPAPGAPMAAEPMPAVTEPVAPMAAEPMPAVTEPVAPMAAEPLQPTPPEAMWTATPSSAASAPGGLDRGPVVAGVVLIVIGLAFLLGRVVTVELGFEAWPLWIVVPGLAMLFGSLFIRERGGVGLAIPGGIVTMVGLVLWFQEATDTYETWAYAWALVAPGGVGLGMFLFGLARGYPDIRDNGLRTMLISVGLFLGFAFFFESVIGLSGNRIANLDTILPAVIVLVGVLVLVLGFFPRRSGAPR